MALAAVWAFLGLRSRPVAVGDLKFPVVMIHDDTRLLIHRNAEELQVLRVGMAMKYDQPPTLIDSDLQIYSMEKLRSTKGGLWLMANPNGMTPISFDLVRQRESGVARARQLLIECKFLGGDDNQKRAALANQTSLAGMIEVLEATPSTPAGE